MSEQDKPMSYMEQLDDWIDLFVIAPLLSHSIEDHEQRVKEVKKAIRGKVLESYHNGQKAGPRKS